MKKWVLAIIPIAMGILIASCAAQDNSQSEVTADDLLAGTKAESNAVQDEPDEDTSPEEVGPFLSDELSVSFPSAEEGLLGPPYPVVLVHGFSGFTDLGPLGYFFEIPAQYEEQEVEVFAPAFPPYQSVEVRAEILAEHLDQILADTKREKVHLICHSQGGMECRRLVSRLGYHDKVAGLVTIAAPHFGTPLAEAVGFTPEGLLNPAGQFLAFMFGFLEELPSSAEDFEEGDAVEAGDWEADLMAAVKAMTPESAQSFNQTHPDHPLVPVYSVAAVSDMLQADALCGDGLLFPPPERVDVLDPLLWGPSRLLVGPDLFNPIPHDGLLQTESMKWGTFLGCVPADHLDQVGQISDLLPNLVSGFSHRSFFDDLLIFLRGLEPVSP